MGSFKIRGSLSRLPIAEGDDVVVFLSLLTPTLYKCYPCDTLTPISLPIFGKYDGYGNLKDIKRDENIKWIEKKLGKIEDVISAFWPTGFDSATIEELINSKNKFHPDESIRYVYKNLLNLEINEKKEIILYFLKDIKEDKISNALRFDGSNSLILSLYENDSDFLIAQKNTVSKMEDFISYALFNHKHFEIPGTIGDFINIEDELNYLNDCIKFLKKRR